MNPILKPTTGLPDLFTDWLRPDSIFNRSFFDLENFPTLKTRINVPSVNVKETPKEFMLEVAAPGLERKDFKIEVQNHTLTISAEKEEKTEKGKETENYWKKEYSYNSFSRSFTLPESVKEDKIDAKYENGILLVHVPKMKETPVKPVRKIAVA